ncbi:MAG: phage portal protein [Ancylobacter novellus]|uniref:Phage portal protein n=1 Tax=Ancylobacter novellus TaxID=921 RepID=A0A2W5MMN5_ANCNO|nr:MAG: phage portal protein [Ancylobacter novellus]
MASWWKPWTWGQGASHADNFIRNHSEGWVQGARRHGLPVTIDTALQLAAVLCAVRVIAEGVAQQPLKVMREELREGRTFLRPATDDPAYRLLHRRPNAWMTSFEWRELMTVHAALTGNAYSIISRVDGRLDELIPVHPDSMQVKLENGEISYRATVNGRIIELDKRDVFHLRGPSMDGVLGLPIVRLARDVLGLASALEHSHIELQAKGGRPSGVLSTDQTLGPDAKSDLREEWNKKFGPTGEGGIAVFDRGWTFTPLLMSAVDQQFIENRRFQIEEIGRIWRVLPLMMMQSDKTASYASSEQFFQAHDIHTLHPWVQRWEQTIDRDLLSDETTYANFVMQGLLRAAAVDRSEYYARALGAPGSRGWMTANEVRALEELDPHPDGDELNLGQQASAGNAVDGGGPNAALPFDPENDDDKAFNLRQPRGPDGRWLSVVARLLGLAQGGGLTNAIHVAFSPVRRPSAIRKMTGVDVKGFRHAAGNQAMRHVLAKHGNPATERARGQIAVTAADFARLPEIVRHGRLVAAKQRPFGPRRIHLVATLQGVEHNYVGEIRSGKRRIDMVSMWKK